MGDGLAAKLGAEDVEVDDPSFSKKHVIKCKDPAFVRALMTPAMVRFFEATDVPRLEIVYNELLLAEETATKTWVPEDFTKRLEWVERFYSLWPQEVLARLEDRPNEESASGA